MAKYCSSCGNPIEDSYKMCPNCGRNLKNDDNQNKKKNNEATTKVISSIISICIFIGLFYFIYSKLSGLFDSTVDKTQYNTDTVYNIGDTLVCPNFEVKIDNVQIKTKGTRIDSYSVIDDAEWIGVTVSVKNTGNETKTFYSSNVNLVNSSGEILEHSFITYKIWGVEMLDSPELISGGSKTGYIQFSNNQTDNSNLTLKVDCNTGLFNDDIIYKVNASQ